MAEQQDLDRNEDATPYKLEKARERGQVAKSADAVSAVVFTVAVAYLTWKGWDGVQGRFRTAHALLAQAGRVDGTSAAYWHLIAGMVTDTAMALAPFFLALMLAGVVANVMQTGPVLSAEPLKMDMNRLNPLQGFKKIFSRRTLFDGARALAKLLVLGLVVVQAIRSLAPQFPQLAGMPPARLARVLLDDVASAGIKMAAALCLIALVDFAYTRREFARQMRMSHRELKDEHKHREGDPRIRARLRELRREVMRKLMAARNTKHADVVLTNPTHVAVALRYRQDEMASPKVVAKGAGALAAAMRKVAAKHRIPVVQSPPLARALYKAIEIEQHVPPAHYAEVARILVWVFAMRQRTQRAGA